MNAADFARLGHAESIARLGSMPAFLDDVLASATVATLGRRSAPGEFSLVEHACHLRDLEREGYLVRVRRILAESRPALEGFDGAAAAASRDYPSQDARQAARDFAAARAELVELLSPLDERDLSREATFMGKPSCLAEVVAMMVEHDRGHREEIEKLAAAR